MLQNAKKRMIAKTPRHELAINCFYGFIGVKEVKARKALFFSMCRDGCDNFNQKYSCPPHSPDFESYAKGNERLFVLLFSLRLKQLDSFGYRDYHKVRLGNAVLKPRMEKVMRALEKKFGSKFLGTGACGLCRPCQLKLKKPCRHPEKRRCSLESVGVDCNHLSRRLFGVPLLWYKDRKAPEYTSVICALPIKSSTDKNLVVEEAEKLLSCQKS